MDSNWLFIPLNVGVAFQYQKMLVVIFPEFSVDIKPVLALFFYRCILYTKIRIKKLTYTQKIYQILQKEFCVYEYKSA